MSSPQKSGATEEYNYFLLEYNGEAWGKSHWWRELPRVGPKNFPLFSQHTSLIPKKKRPFEKKQQATCNLVIQKKQPAGFLAFFLARARLVSAIPCSFQVGFFSPPLTSSCLKCPSSRGILAVLGSEHLGPMAQLRHEM